MTSKNLKRNIFFLALAVLLALGSYYMTVQEPTIKLSEIDQRYLKIYPVNDGQFTVIDTAAAYDLYNNGVAVFMDARTDRSYQNAHIPDAVNIYHRFGADHPFVQNLQKDQLIVTYCISKKCPMGHYLAEKLVQAGYRRVLLYEAGLQDWADHGHPMRQVAAPDS